MPMFVFFLKHAVDLDWRLNYSRYKIETQTNKSWKDEKRAYLFQTYLRLSFEQSSKPKRNRRQT